MGCETSPLRRGVTIWNDEAMDFSLTWEGVAALLALGVSLYNLWEARRAPAKARQRELRDELRVLLEGVAAEILAFRAEVQEGDELDSGSKFRDSAAKLERLGPRITGSQSRLSLIASKLQHIADCRLRVIGNAHDIQWIRDAEELGVVSPDGDLETVSRDDLDAACEGAVGEVQKELERLRVLESR